MKYKYYLTLSMFSLLFCLDGFVGVGYVWEILSKFNSIFGVGVSFFVASTVCFFIQNKSKFLRTKITDHLYKTFFIAVFVLFIYTVVVYEFELYKYYLILISSIIIYTTFIFMNYFFIDIFILKNVDSGLISHKNASAHSQVVMQIGAILGFLIAGKIFDTYEIKGIIVTILFIQIFLLFLSILLDTLNFKTSNMIQFDTEKVPIKSLGFQNSTTPFASLGCIFLLSLQLANFNLILPNILLHSKHLSASVFGYMSGIASIGAFLASFIVYQGKGYFFYILFSSLFIVLVDFMLAFSTQTGFCILVCFILGFSLNALRTTFRKMIFEQASFSEKRQLLISISTFLTFIPRSFFPLIVSFFISDKNQQYIFVLIGFIVSVSIVFIHFYFKFYGQKIFLQGKTYE